MATRVQAEILKPDYGDSSNGGISSEFTEVYVLIGDGGLGEAPGLIDKPLVRITKGPLGTVRAERADIAGNVVTYGGSEKTVGPMFGGCYIATSDSRFSREVERVLGSPFYGAVALHDRWETPAQYEALSR